MWVFLKGELRTVGEHVPVHAFFIHTHIIVDDVCFEYEHIFYGSKKFEFR